MKKTTTYTAAIFLICTCPLLAQNSVFTDADLANSDWSNALNWDPGEPGATDDAHISDGLMADITAAGETARLVHIGDARTGATDGRGFLTMRSGDLTALGIKIGSDSDGLGAGAVNGTFDFIDGTITLNPADQALGNGLEIGSATPGLDGITDVTGRMTMGDGTTNPVLNFTESHVEVGWRAGSTAFFEFKSGTITGTDNGFDPNLVLGQVIGSTGTATMTIGGFATPALFMTDTFCNHNGGNATLTIDSNGTLNVDRLSFSNDPASTTSLVRVNTGGTLIVRDRLDDRAGVSTLQIDGGTVNLQNENAAAIYREVDDLVLGGSDAGSTLALPVGSVPVNILVGTGSGVQATGTHNIEATSVASGINDAELTTTWTGGTDAWVNAASAKWSGFAAPDGGVPVGATIPVIKSIATIPGASAATFGVTGAEAGKFSGAGAMTDLVADDTIALTVGTSFDVGALRAVIDDPASIVSRTGDLRVARDEAADAQQLDVTDGSFTLTGGELVIGGMQDNDAGPIFVGGVLNDASNVTVAGGTMTVPSVRFFGDTPLPPLDPNDVAMGGILNVNGGTLTVTGDIIEGPGAGDTSVQQARIDVDGGVLDMASPTATITVQHFRVANDVDTTGSFTLKDGQTINVEGGSFQVANNGNADGTFTAEAGSTLNVSTTTLNTPVDGFIIANNNTNPGIGRFVSNGATINTGCRVKLADGGTGIVTLNDGTVWNSTGNRFQVGDGDNPNASDHYGGDATLIMNGNASITHTGDDTSTGGGNPGRFEMAITNAGSRTVHRPIMGTLIMNDDSSITVNGSVNPDFRLGLNANHIVSVTLNDQATIDVARHVQNNSGAATVEMTGGAIIIGNKWNCSNNSAGSTTISIGGTGFVETTSDFDFRTGGEDKLSLSEVGELQIGRDLLMDKDATTPTALGLNELNISGADATLIVARNLTSNGKTRITFTPDAALGVSTLTVEGTCTLATGGTNTQFVFDNSVAGLTSATDLGDQVLIATGAPTLGSFEGLPEGATVKAYPDGTEYQITYAGGDGNDIALLAVTDGDSDMDGMPRSYEDANGLSDDDATDATSDFDNDGFTALFEYAMGTLAGDGTSTPVWEMNRVSPTQVDITYGPVKVGQTYTVQSTADGTTWTEVTAGNNPLTPGADAATITVNDTTGGEAVELYQLTVTLP